MQPLERGCLAMIINSSIGNNGKIVTIGNFLGAIEHYKGDDYWEVSPGIITNRGRISHVGHEFQLMRIDDFDGDDVEAHGLVLEGEDND